MISELSCKSSSSGMTKARRCRSSIPGRRPITFFHRSTRGPCTDFDEIATRVPSTGESWAGSALLALLDSGMVEIPPYGRLWENIVHVKRYSNSCFPSPLSKGLATDTPAPPPCVAMEPTLLGIWEHLAFRPIREVTPRKKPIHALTPHPEGAPWRDLA